MAQFRYYITNTFDGTVRGTDSTDLANDLRHQRLTAEVYAAKSGWKLVTQEAA